MKKKLVATAIACVLGTSCLFAAACNKGNNEDADGVKTSVEVTAEQWKEAFDKTQKTTNLTAKTVAKESNSSNSQFSSMEFTFYLTENNFAIDFKNKFGDKDEAKERVVKGYGEKDNAYWYSAYNTDGDWNISVSKDNTKDLQPVFATFSAKYATSADATESFPLGQLYSSFKFTNGAYKAKLYESYSSNTTSSAFDIEIKFNGDGYISYIGTSGSRTNDNYTTTSTGSVTYSNFGTTTVTENAEAKQAITDYKAAHSDTAN